MPLDTIASAQEDSPSVANKPDASKRTESFVWGIPQTGLAKKGAGGFAR